MTINFLRKVLPDGLIVVARPASKGFVQVVCNSIDEAVEQAAKFDQEGKDCYFGLGSLREPFILETRKNKITGEPEEVKAVRVGANIAQMKCLFIDLDVGADDPKKYADQLEAGTALRQFCKDTQFPHPMIVNSGGGLHAYWPFDKAVPVDQWRVLAQTFKGVLAAYGLKADPTRTADASSVLRVAGTHNYKGGGKRAVYVLKDVEPIARKDILSAVIRLSAQYGIAVTPKPVAAPVGALGGNLEKVYEPSDINKIITHCAQMKALVATGGDGEPVWYAGLQVARHTIEPIYAATLISQAHPQFNMAEMKNKLANLESKNIGPATCSQFYVTNAALCGDCPHRGKITSPIQLGQETIRHIPITIEVTHPITKVVEKVEVPIYPFPYKRGPDGQVLLAQKNSSGIEEMIMIHEHELRPIKRTRSERYDIESTVWRVNQPIQGYMEFTIEQSLLARPDALHGMLLSKGLYVTPGRTKLMVSFMIAYIKDLQKQVVVEQLFSRLGWRDDYSRFVSGSVVYNKDGTSAAHQTSPEIASEVPGLGSAGTLERWKDAVQFFKAEGHEAHRTMLYSGFGSLLLHMTGHKGVVIAATGEPGAGKTTAMMASNSIYGHPEDLLVSGNQSGATENALYSLLAARNHLPMALDEVTRMDVKVLGRFCLAVPQGRGKRVNTKAGTLSQNVPTWGNITQMSANTDMYSALAQSRADASAEAVRLFQLAFVVPKSHTKTDADQFLRDLKANYGHAGPVFIQYVITHYALVKRKVEAAMALVDKRATISSGERFWSGLIAAEFVGAMCARHLGLLEGFPIEQDFDWNIQQLSASRRSMVEHIASSREILSEFLEARVGETLVVSQTTKGNIAPRVEQAPRGALCIRHDVDLRRIFIMKSEFKRYCAEIGANHGSIQTELELKQVLLDRNKQVVLGKGTDFGKGQVRCWEIDLTELQEGV